MEVLPADGENLDHPNDGENLSFARGEAERLEIHLFGELPRESSQMLPALSPKEDHAVQTPMPDHAVREPSMLRLPLGQEGKPVNLDCQVRAQDKSNSSSSYHPEEDIQPPRREGAQGALEDPATGGECTESERECTPNSTDHGTAAVSMTTDHAELGKDELVSSSLSPDVDVERVDATQSLGKSSELYYAGDRGREDAQSRRRHYSITIDPKSKRVLNVAAVSDIRDVQATLQRMSLGSSTERARTRPSINLAHSMGNMRSDHLFSARPAKELLSQSQRILPTTQLSQQHETEHAEEQQRPRSYHIGTPFRAARHVTPGLMRLKMSADAAPVPLSAGETATSTALSEASTSIIWRFSDRRKRQQRYCTPYTSLELSACRQQLYLVEVNGTEKLILEPRVAVMDCHITPSAKRGFARLHSNKHPSWGIEIPRECWQKILRLQRRETAALEHSETDSTRLDDRCRSQQLDLLAAQPDIRTTTAPKRARHHRPRMTFSEVSIPLDGRNKMPSSKRGLESGLHLFRRLPATKLCHAAVETSVEHDDDKSLSNFSCTQEPANFEDFVQHFQKGIRPAHPFMPRPPPKDDALSMPSRGSKASPRVFTVVGHGL